MEDYFADRELMTFGAMIVDAVTSPPPDDCTMAQWYRDAPAALLWLWPTSWIS